MLCHDYRNGVWTKNTLEYLKTIWRLSNFQNYVNNSLKTASVWPYRNIWRTLYICKLRSTELQATVENQQFLVNTFFKRLYELWNLLCTNFILAKFKDIVKLLHLCYNNVIQRKHARYGKYIKQNKKIKGLHDNFSLCTYLLSKYTD